MHRMQMRIAENHSHFVFTFGRALSSDVCVWSRQISLERPRTSEKMEIAGENQKERTLNPFL